MLDTSHFAVGVLAIFVLVFANGFFVAAEFALVTVRKTRIDQLIAEGHRGARTVRRALNDPDSYIAATQLGITMASLGLGWVGEPALASVIEPPFHVLGEYISAITAHSIAVVISFSIITALHIVLGELAPKTTALQHSEAIALLVARPTELFMRLCWPFIKGLNGLGSLVVRAVGLRPPSGHSLVHSEEELKMLVTASQEAGVLEEEEEQMLHRVFGFSDLTAGQVMVPRTEMVALPFDASLVDIADTLARGGHSRLPVYRKNLDDIVGMLHVTDLFSMVAGGKTPTDLTGVLRDAFTVPETMQAGDLLSEMRDRHTPVAIVIDEFGGTAGLVTFAGLMEHIDEEAYNTIGGFVLGRLGRRARVGDRFELEKRTLRVEALDGLRVARVFLSKEKDAEQNVRKGSV
jgi:putative hemolysin